MNHENNTANYHVDLIRAAAMFLVILQHAAIEPHPLATQIDQAEIIRWWSVTIYNSIAQSCVPLFVMLSGALLLQRQKIEPLGTFFKKRVNRIALPFLFWTIIYFTWRQFVHGETLTVDTILRGLETGPYYHFWFIYMLVGLYLITPMLRIFIAHAERKLIKYTIILWLTGTTTIAFLWFIDHGISASLFLLLGWPGYYILGMYLREVKTKPVYLYIAIFIGLTCTIMGTYYTSLLVGGERIEFFLDALRINVILTSAALFLLLQKISPERLRNRFPRLDWLIHKIGQNTLPIYLLHIIVIETLQGGSLGFAISLNTLNPVYEIPLLAASTLLVSLGIVLILKKIPVINRVIG